MHFQCKTFSKLPLKSTSGKSEDERKQKGRAYDNTLNSAFGMGNKISLSRFARRHKSAMPPIADANLRCRGRANLEWSCKQRSYSYAHRISAENIFGGFGQTLERTFLAHPATRVSAVAEVILGATLLGNRLWRVEYRQNHG